MERLIKFKNKYTGSFVIFKFYPFGTPKNNGLVVQKAKKECAYKLGCNVEDLEGSVIT